MDFNLKQLTDEELDTCLALSRDEFYACRKFIRENGESFEATTDQLTKEFNSRIL